MPPAQCPECGRFLSKAFVSALTDEPSPCPGCQTPLMGADFGSSRKASDPTPENTAADPLAGWDDGRVVDIDDWRSGAADGPSDAAVVGLGAVVGAIIGLLLGPRRSLFRALLGAVVGASAGAASRRIWELPD